MPYTNDLIESVSIRESRRRPRKARRDMMYPFNLPQTRWFRKGVPPKTDAFRQKSYRSERAAGQLWAGKQFESIKEIRYFLRHFMESAWFQARFPDFQTCVVEYNPHMKNAHAGPRRTRRDFEGEIVVISGSIALGRETRSQRIVLHELAHAVLPHQHLHDRRWARTFLEFVRMSIGESAYQALRDGMRANNVRYTPWRRGGGAPPAVLRRAAAKAREMRTQS